MRTQLLFAGLLGCLFAAEMSPATARACSCLATAIYRADPEDGTRDVPLNKGLMVEGVFVQDSIKLENGAGESIDVTVYAGPTPSCAGTWAELVPKQPLEPNTKYTIRVQPIYPGDEYQAGATALSFTTGSELLPNEVLEAPSAIGSVVLGAPESGGCASTDAMACVGVADRKNVEIVARVGDRVLLRWLLPSEADLMFGFAEAPECLEFRRRSSTGQRSAPFTICNDRLGTRQFRASDLEKGGWVACHDGVIGAKAAGDVGLPPSASGEDAGLDPDESFTNPNPSSHSTAGASSTPPNTASQATEPEHETFGCTAVPAAPASAPSWFFVLMFALWIAIRSGKRTRRDQG